MLRITGLELTQSIQYFGSTYPVCGPPTARHPCADNSLSLVAEKPTAVRVYFDGATPNVPVTGFGVRLLPDGSPTATTFAGRSDLTNVPSPPAREDAAQSLNLLIPPADARGTWRLSVSIFEKTTPGVGQVAARAIDLGFVERALVPIRLVRMHYTGRGLDVPAPTIADFWAMADFAQRAWPIPLPGFCIVRDSVEVFDGVFHTQQDVEDPPEAGTTGTMWDIMRRLRASEGLPPDVIYFAFYPDPAGANGGAGGGRMFVAPNVIPELMTHELGHAYGLMHAPAPGTPGPDPNYPSYGALTPGSIGEVGFDPRAERAFPPDWFDFMGYANQRWISPYNDANLFSLIGPPVPGPCSAPSLPEKIFIPPKQRFFVCAYAEDEPGGGFLGKICGPKIPLEFDWPPPDGPPDPIRAALLDARGETIFEDTFGLSSYSEPADGPARRLFTITMPELAAAERLVVTLGDQVVEDTVLSRSPVAFEARAAVVDDETATVRVEWTLSPEAADAPVWVRTSTDEGRSWTAFSVPAGATYRDIDRASLPPGSHCLVEVLAGERLQTAAWRSDPLPLHPRRESVVVLRPEGTIKAEYGVPLELAAVTSSGAGSQGIHWSSDRDGELGEGGYQLAMLSPGRHVLSVRLGAAGERRRAAVVRVAAPRRRGQPG